MAPIIQCLDLAKEYEVRERRGLFASTRRRIAALRGVTLDVEEGEFFGLLGRNGAGKTTLLKCLTTLLLPTSGSARVNGFDIVRQPSDVRASLGCMLAGERGLYWKLTGRENLEYFAALHSLSGPRQKRRTDDVIERLDLRPFIDRQVETYSSGQRMKIAFARALVVDAPILVLDEPTNTLDVHAARELRLLLSQLHREGRTIVFSTHILAEAEALCDRVAIVEGGVIAAVDAPARLTRSLFSTGTIRIAGDIPEAGIRAVSMHPLVLGIAVSDEAGRTTLRVSASDVEACMGEVIRLLVSSGSLIHDLEVQRPKLEEAFMEITIDGVRPGLRENGRMPWTGS